MSCHHGHHGYGCDPCDDWPAWEGMEGGASARRSVGLEGPARSSRRAQTIEELEAELEALRAQAQRVQWRIEAIHEHDPLGDRRPAERGQ